MLSSSNKHQSRRTSKKAERNHKHAWGEEQLFTPLAEHNSIEGDPQDFLRFPLHCLYPFQYRGHCESKVFSQVDAQTGSSSVQCARHQLTASSIGFNFGFLPSDIPTSAAFTMPLF